MAAGKRGTRTASICGGWIALHDACSRLLQRDLLKRHPIREACAAISVGVIDGTPMLDLEYREDVRAEVDIEPSDDPDSGMGAWHVNVENEAHTVRTGAGLVEFWTPAGPVAAVIREGVVMVVRGGEHRYRPLTPQRWAIRHSGDADADLGPSSTHRPSGPWPDVDA